MKPTFTYDVLKCCPAHACPIAGRCNLAVTGLQWLAAPDPALATFVTIGTARNIHTVKGRITREVGPVMAWPPEHIRDRSLSVHQVNSVGGADVRSARLDPERTATTYPPKPVAGFIDDSIRSWRAGLADRAPTGSFVGQTIKTCQMRRSSYTSLAVKANEDMLCLHLRIFVSLPIGRRRLRVHTTPPPTP